MTILKKTGALFIVFMTMIAALAACDLDISTLPSQEEVKHVDVIEMSLQNAYVIDDFDLSAILMEAEEEGGDVRTVPLKRDYLDDASLDALEETGRHTLQGEYEGQAFSFEIRLVGSSRDLLMHTLYTLGVEDAALEDDYETWLDTIQGVSVTDASVDDEGMLDLTLSDETTIEAGLVKGGDGVDGQGIESIHRENGDELVFTYDDGSEDRLAIEFDPNTVKFKTENETMIDVQYVLDGGSFSHPGAPEREGHTFSGWSEDETTEVDDDMTVYAEYSRNAYDLTFDTDSDEGTYTDTYEYGDTIDYPSLSENGREFIGWYADEAFTTLFAEDAMPAQDTTLHARWVEEDTSSINIADMAESVRGSMVSVININEDEGGSGSGVIYKENDDDSYYVFTNHHVVEGHESLEIEYDYNFNQYVSRDSNVEFIGSYAEADIAVIRFTPNPDHSVKAIGFADSYALRTGETVYAYGSPQGPQYAHSMTTGIIGNPLRMERLDDTDAAFIQHDAAISPGNSGGALLDAHGNVIGMNTLKIVSEEVEGMGFALPSNTIQRMVRDLEDDGEVERAVLGVTMTSVENCDYKYGACIDSVDPGTPAETLGLQGGDQVIAFKRASMEDFYTIYNENYLYQAIMDTEVGETITIEYVHDEDIEEESVIME